MDTDCKTNGLVESKLASLLREYDLSEEFLEDFCKRASTSFFRQYGLLSHQINSYNDFLKTGIQSVFDSFGEINMQPVYDPLGSETVPKYATVKFGKVTLERPMFWAGESFSMESGTEYLRLLPKHARLQNITYSARMSVQIQFQVRSLFLSFNYSLMF